MYAHKNVYGLSARKAQGFFFRENEELLVLKLNNLICLYMRRTCDNNESNLYHGNVYTDLASVGCPLYVKESKCLAIHSDDKKYV